MNENDERPAVAADLELNGFILNKKKQNFFKKILQQALKFLEKFELLMIETVKIW